MCGGQDPGWMALFLMGKTTLADVLLWCPLSPARVGVPPDENAWAEPDKRLRKTDPGTLELEKDFKVRVGNAVARLVDNDKLEHAVESTPRRLLGCEQLGGARASY